MTTLAFFSNLLGVGTTTLVRHLGDMLAELGRQVVLIDLDPQYALTRSYLGDDPNRWSSHPLSAWQSSKNVTTIVSSQTPHFGRLRVGERLYLVKGDLRWSTFETDLTEAWGHALDDDALKRSAALETLLTFRHMVEEARVAHDADLVLVDLGPGLGAFNLAAFLAVDGLVLTRSPLRASGVGLDNLRGVLDRWTNGWDERCARSVTPEPPHAFPPILGHIMLTPDAQPAREESEAIMTELRDKADRSASFGLAEPPGASVSLGVLRHQPSLMALAHEARKPMFHLTPADGAIGAYMNAVVQCREDFRRLAQALLARLPST